MSYCPIDLEAIDVKLLTEKEKRWLNDCHKEVYNKLFPYLNDDQNE